MNFFFIYYLYSAFTDEVESNCHFPAPGWICKVHRQALQGFPETCQVPLHKHNKTNLPLFLQFLPGAARR
jgi:hypothetical protein